MRVRCTGRSSGPCNSFICRSNSRSTAPNGTLRSITSVMAFSGSVFGFLFSVNEWTFCSSTENRKLELQRPPLPTVRHNDAVGLDRSPRTALVLRQIAHVHRAPMFENRHYELPGRLDTVTTHEQRGVAGHYIENQTLVGLRRRAAER